MPRSGEGVDARSKGVVDRKKGTMKCRMQCSHHRMERRRKKKRSGERNGGEAGQPVSIGTLSATATQLFDLGCVPT